MTVTTFPDGALLLGYDQADPANVKIVSPGASAVTALRSLLNASAANPSLPLYVYDVHLGQSYKSDVSGLQGFVIDDVIDVPPYVSLLGRGRASRLVISPGSQIGPFFRLNTTDGQKWTAAFPGPLSGRIADLQVNVAGPVGSGVYLNLFDFGGSYEFENMLIGGFSRAIRQIPGVNDPDHPEWVSYCDMVTIRRISFFDQIQGNDIKRYWIELAYNGDASVIDQCQFQFIRSTPDVVTQRKSADAIWVRYRSGIEISNILNGNILIQACSNTTVRGLHHEDGKVTFLDSTGLISDSRFYMRSDKIALSTVPLTFSYNSGKPLLKPSVVSCENLSFWYEKEFNGGLGYSLTKPNFELLADGRAFPGIVKISNVIRDWASMEGGNAAIRLGVTCGMADFDNYSHIASLTSEFAGEGWRINGSLSNLPQANDVILPMEISQFDFWHDPEGTTGNIPATTYYYRAQLLYDKKREIGITGAERSATVAAHAASQTSTFVKAPLMTIRTEVRRNAILRIFRGTSANTYSSVVEVPVLAGAYLVDSGTDVGGYAWQDRAAGPAPAINSYSVISYELSPGGTETGSDAYGQASLRVSSTSTAPGYGGWRRGDRVIVEGASPSSGKIFRGWLRLTNGMQQPATNILGTDWVPIYDSIS